MDVLQAEQQAFQALLEGHRLDPGNEELWADLCKAGKALEVAWLERVAGVDCGGNVIAPARLASPGAGHREDDSQ